MTTAPNPFATIDLASFARRLREGAMTAESVTRGCLARIAAGADRDLLTIAMGIEDVLGRPALPSLER